MERHFIRGTGLIRTGIDIDGQHVREWSVSPYPDAPGKQVGEAEYDIKPGMVEEFVEVMVLGRGYTEALNDPVTTA